MTAARSWAGRRDASSPRAGPVIRPRPRARARAVAGAEVDVFPTVEVPDAAAVGRVEVHRVAEGAVEARGGGDAAGQVPAGALILFDDAIHEGDSGEHFGDDLGARRQRHRPARA